jgi:GNAT superfamily N-acetyltransferase
MGMPIKDFVRKIVGGVFSASPKISAIQPEDIPEVLDVCSVVFSKVMSPGGVKSYINGSADWSISAKAEYKGRIVGCYILNRDPVTRQQHCSKEDLGRYKGMKGVQGIGLAVLPEYRDFGIGKKLREYPLQKGYDYIWGLHMKGLHNIDNWTRFGRRIICDSGSMFTTLMDLSRNAKMDLMENGFEGFHSFQKAGHTCGPTCVQMVADFLGAGYNDIDHIIDLCGCNTRTGTIDTGIKSALDSLGIANERNPRREDTESAMGYLNALLENGDLFIMRTLTKGVKHWIIVYGKRGDSFLIADPWLGKIAYDEDQILKIWEPRDFDGFLIKKH